MAKRKVAEGFWWDTDTGIGYVDFRLRGRGSYRVQRIIRGAGYKEAFHAYSLIREEAERQQSDPRAIPTLEEYWRDFSRLRPLRPGTLRIYQYMLDGRIFKEFRETRLDRITPPCLLEFRAALSNQDLSAAYINRHITLIRMLLNEARLRGLLADHPVPTGVIRPLKENPPIVAYLSSEERASFLGSFDDEDAFRNLVTARRHLGPVKVGAPSPHPRRYGGGHRGDSQATGLGFQHFRSAKPAFLCALDTGLSRADLIDLRWHQVDLQVRMIRVTRIKTNVSVNIPLTQRLANAFLELGPQTTEQHVFCTLEGAPWSETMLKRYFAIAKQLAGITRPFRFHDMRHDFASALAQEGVSLYLIAQLLGHTSTRVTSRYAHLSPLHLRAAIDALPGR